jgi:hypothetical protein
MTRTALAAVAIGCGLAGAAAAQPKANPALLKALADWEGRQARVRTARYVITGTREWVAKASPADPAPAANDRVRPSRLVAVLDLARGRYRYELSYDILKDDGSYRWSTSLGTFDGRESRQGKPREEAREYGGFDLVISPDYERAQGGATPNPFLWPVLYAHGLVPHAYHTAGFARLPWRYDPEDFVHVGRLPLAGRACEVIRTEPNDSDPPGYDEYWVDPARDGAVLRYADVVGTNPLTRTDLRWRATPAGWQLDGWTTATLAAGRTTLAVHTYRVESAEFDGPVADADFTIPAEPGMERVRVNEYDPRPGVILGAYRYYRIDPDGTWVQTDSKGAYTVDGHEPPPPPRRPWWHWAAAAAGAAGVAGVVWGRLRRRGSPAGAAPAAT